MIIRMKDVILFSALVYRCECFHIYVFKVVIFLLKNMQMSWTCLEVQMTFPQAVMEKTNHQLQDSPL